MNDLEKVINQIYEDRHRIYKKYGKEKGMKERLKSPVVWTQFVLLIAEFLKIFGLYEMPNDLINSIQDFITLGFNIFAGLNNPTTREKF